MDSGLWDLLYAAEDLLQEASAHDYHDSEWVSAFEDWQEQFERWKNVAKCEGCTELEHEKEGLLLELGRVNEENARLCAGRSAVGSGDSPAA